MHSPIAQSASCPNEAPKCGGADQCCDSDGGGASGGPGGGGGGGGAYVLQLYDLSDFRNLLVL